MNALPAACVVDASVAIKLVLLEEYTPQVQGFFLRLGDDIDAFAPDLLQTECANVLWRQVCMKGYALAQAQRDMVDLLALAVQWTPTPALLPRAFEIATTYGATVYDSCYVALAERLNLPLLTHDKRLANRLVHSAHLILTLDALFANAS
jgi:predicted nucleic acid-binding protein